jgi:hypothetical protein
VPQVKLNAIDASVFPLPSTLAPWQAVGEGRPQSLPAQGIAGSNLLKFWLRPVARQGVDSSACIGRAGARFLELVFWGFGA